MTLSLRAKLARSLSFLSGVRGSRRLLQSLAGDQGAFRISLDGAVMTGDLSSYIEKQAFLFNGYEREFIDLFLSRVPRGGTVLDVGANIGNHTLIFSGHFDAVHSFEPNPVVLAKLRQNVDQTLKANPGRAITVHPVGLGKVAEELPFYNIFNGNEGLGTFLKVEQYDRPLEQVQTLKIERADDYLGEISVSAIKIDVQGFEPNVLRGMQNILARNKPVIWLEFGEGTEADVPTLADVQTLFPYPIRMERFVGVSSGLFNRITLVPHPGPGLVNADYLILPV